MAKQEKNVLTLRFLIVNHASFDHAKKYENIETWMQKILRSLIRLLLEAKETQNKFYLIPIVWAKSVLFSQPICIWTPNFCMTFGISANQDLANHPVLISSSHLPGKSPTLSVDIIATVDRPTPMKQHFCHIPTIVTPPFTHLQGKEWAQPLAMNEWAVCPKKGAWTHAQKPTNRPQ